MQKLNSHLDPLQAAFPGVKLRRQREWKSRRRRVATMYVRELRDVPSLILPGVPTWAKPSWHLFLLRAPHRHELQQALEAAGAGTLGRYPIPPHRSWLYAAAANNNGALSIAGE